VGLLDDERAPYWFAGDGLLTPGLRFCGLPIGNLTSQFFANVILNELDQYVHHEIRPAGYVRYADDWVLFDNDVETLKKAKLSIEKFLARYRLLCHANKTYFAPCRQGFVFLGFRLTPRGKRIARENVSRFRKRMRRYNKLINRHIIDYDQISASIKGWLQHLSHGNTAGIISKVMPNVKFRKI